MIKKLLSISILMLIITSSIVIALDITCHFTSNDPNWGADVSFSSPYPTNQSWQDVSDKELKIHVSNDLGETMNVSFHWSDHTLIDYNDSATNDTTVTITYSGNYDRYTQYDWYVNVTSVTFNNQSGQFWFKGEAYDWDIDRDADVDITDVNFVRDNYLETTAGRNDVTGDGYVNYLDRSRVQYHWGDDYS